MSIGKRSVCESVCQCVRESVRPCVRVSVCTCVRVSVCLLICSRLFSQLATASHHCNTSFHMAIVEIHVVVS